MAVRFLIASFVVSALLSASPVLAADGHATGAAAFEPLSKFLVGQWTRSDKPEFKHTYKWAIQGKFLQRKVVGGVVDDVGIIGVDPVSKQCTWWTFNGDGSIGHLTCKLEFDGVWLLEEYGEGVNGENRYKGKLKRVDENTIEELCIEWVFDGKPQQTGTYTWNRKTK